MSKGTTNNRKSKAFTPKNIIDLTEAMCNTETKASTHNNTPKQKSRPRNFNSLVHSEIKSMECSSKFLFLIY